MNTLSQERKQKALNDKKFGVNQFAGSLGISPAHLSRIEHNKKKPTPELAITACKLLEIESDTALAEFNLLPPDIKDTLISHKYRPLYYDLIRSLECENARTFNIVLKLIKDGSF